MGFRNFLEETQVEEVRGVRIRRGFRLTNYFYLWQSSVQSRAFHEITSHHTLKQTSGPTDCLVTFANWTKMWVSLESSFSLSHICATENDSLFFIFHTKGSVNPKTSPSCTLHQKEPVNVASVDKKAAWTHTDVDIEGVLVELQETVFKKRRFEGLAF